MLTRPTTSLRIRVPIAATIEFFGDETQKEAFDRDVALLAASGTRTEYLDFKPLYAIARMLYELAWIAERHTVIDAILKSDPNTIHPITRQIITHAETMSAADAFRGIYRQADLKRAAEPMLEALDMLCVQRSGRSIRWLILRRIRSPQTPTMGLIRIL